MNIKWTALPLPRVEPVEEVFVVAVAPTFSDQWHGARHVSNHAPGHTMHVIPVRGGLAVVVWEMSGGWVQVPPKRFHADPQRPLTLVERLQQIKRELYGDNAD